MTLLEQIQKLETDTLRQLTTAKTGDAIENLRVKVLGRKGLLTDLMKQLKDLDLKTKKEVGPKANAVKQNIQESIEAKLDELTSSSTLRQVKQEWLDVTAPAQGKNKGHLHPITHAQRRVGEIFTSLGFELVDGPQVDTEHYNFDVLNIPKDHPARDLWDTFWVKADQTRKTDDRFVMRTHTSNMQVRVMEGRTPPLRIAVPGGRCFRHEATDATHEHTFHQVEGFVVGEGVSIADLKGTLIAFLELYFQERAEIRLRPSYFPFVEPGYEVDMRCIFCQGAGCRVCSQTGWIEILGAGMIHPVVLENSQIDPRQYSGFAFGAGLDRLVMMQNNIEDMRHFFSGDLRFLEQF